MEVVHLFHARHRARAKGSVVWPKKHWIAPKRGASRSGTVYTGPAQNNELCISSLLIRWMSWIECVLIVAFHTPTLNVFRFLHIRELSDQAVAGSSGNLYMSNFEESWYGGCFANTNILDTVTSFSISICWSAKMLLCMYAYTRRYSNASLIKLASWPLMADCWSINAFMNSADV